MSRSQAEHGIYVSHSGERPVIRKNVVFGNRANGIHMNGDVSQGGDGIISDALVADNTIYDNGLGGGSGINCDGVQSSIFRDNLLYNNHASGISLYQIDAAQPARGNQVLNNTIVMASAGRSTSRTPAPATWCATTSCSTSRRSAAASRPPPTAWSIS